MEGLFSLSIIMLLCLTLFPFFMNHITKLSEAKRELQAIRQLFEYVQLHSLKEEAEMETVTIRNMTYYLFFEDDGHGKRACVQYEHKKHCVE